MRQKVKREGPEGALVYRMEGLHFVRCRILETVCTQQIFFVVL